MGLAPDRGRIGAWASRWAGGVGTSFEGGKPPTRPGAVMVQAGVALVVVTAFIPLAWDRYFLSIQPGFALLGFVRDGRGVRSGPRRSFGGPGAIGAGSLKTSSSRPKAWVFVILLASSSYFWQARDWNVASRLMLTYALVDRGTLTIDGLDDQTRDIARYRGHFYSDKTPGTSCWRPSLMRSPSGPSGCPTTRSIGRDSRIGRRITGPRSGRPGSPRR